MGKVCLQCGDIGYENQLVFCSNCMQHARHRYCMDTLPLKDDQVITWLCDECESSKKSRKRKIRKNFSPQSDRQVAIISGKENRTGKKSRDRNNFLYSFARKQDPEYTQAEPLICSVWTGIFDIVYADFIYKRMEGVHGFLSTKACRKVREAAVCFQTGIQFQMAPRSSLWPKSFAAGLGPTDDNIAVYFLPSLAKQDDYDYLVFEIVRDDLAMRAYVQDVEFLVFASTVLPERFWRFQGRLYLWGVFKGKGEGSC